MIIFYYSSAYNISLSTAYFTVRVLRNFSDFADLQEVTIELIEEIATLQKQIMESVEEESYRNPEGIEELFKLNDYAYEVMRVYSGIREGTMDMQGAQAAVGQLSDLSTSITVGETSVACPESPPALIRFDSFETSSSGSNAASASVSGFSSAALEETASNSPERSSHVAGGSSCDRGRVSYEGDAVGDGVPSSSGGESTGKAERVNHDMGTGHKLHFGSLCASLRSITIHATGVHTLSPY